MRYIVIAVQIFVGILLLIVAGAFLLSVPTFVDALVHGNAIPALNSLAWLLGVMIVVAICLALSRTLRPRLQPLFVIMALLAGVTVGCVFFTGNIKPVVLDPSARTSMTIVCLIGLISGYYLTGMVRLGFMGVFGVLLALLWMVGPFVGLMPSMPTMPSVPGLPGIIPSVIPGMAPAAVITPTPTPLPAGALPAATVYTVDEVLEARTYTVAMDGKWSRNFILPQGMTFKILSGDPATKVRVPNKTGGWQEAFIFSNASLNGSQYSYKGPAGTTVVFEVTPVPRGLF